MLFPHTTSRRITLRPAGVADLGEFGQTILRTGLESIPPAGFPPAMMSMFQAAFQVLRRSDGQALGFGALHALNTAGHIRCGVYLDPQHTQLGIGSDAIYLLTNYAFASFDIDRMFTETTEASFAALGVTAEGGLPDGTLREHLYFGGQLWDMYGGVTVRSDWESHIDMNPDGVLPPPLTWRTPPH